MFGSSYKNVRSYCSNNATQQGNLYSVCKKLSSQHSSPTVITSGKESSRKDLSEWIIIKPNTYRCLMSARVYQMQLKPKFNTYSNYTVCRVLYFESSSRVTDIIHLNFKAESFFKQNCETPCFSWICRVVNWISLDCWSDKRWWICHVRLWKLQCSSPTICNHPTEETHFSSVYLRSPLFSHYQKPTTTAEGQNGDRLPTFYSWLVD